MKLIENNKKPIPISTTEEFILNWDAVPKELYMWRYYRLEYGGCNEDCFLERPIYLPPQADSYILELLFDFWQAKKKRKILHKIIQELERVCANDQNTGKTANLSRGGKNDGEGEQGVVEISHG